MSKNNDMEFDIPKDQSSIIKVIGVGGGGGNAVNHMYNQGIKGVDFVICNTDQQALDISPVPIKMQLGASLTEGRGAGAIPEIGKNAAIENIDDIKAFLQTNTKMVFITAGMGGGTGTGAAPVIAKVAKDMGILTVGIVTVPFSFEGRKRKLQAEEGLEEMRKNVDTLLIINNDRLREMFGNLSLGNAFAQADDVLAIAAKGIAEVISVTGMVNVDFNDVSTVMRNSGVAIMGSAVAEGENRAIEAVRTSLASPLLNDNDIQGAKYVLLNITYGSKEILMDEIGEITDYIQDEAGATADVIWGHGYDESLGDKLCVTIIATGFNTTPHTGLSMKAPKKNIMNLEDDSPEIITNESEQLTEPVTNTVEESFEETPEQNPSESAMKRYVLEEDDETSEENEITNDAEESDNSNLYEQNTQQNDGKVRFLLEDDEMPNLDTDLKQSENTQILEADLMTANDEEKIVDQVKQVESKAISDERLERIKKATDKLRSPLGLNEMESEPAYKRRNVDLKDVKYSDDSSSSRYTLWENINDSGEKETGLSDNNSFLHDNVD